MSTNEPQSRAAQASGGGPGGRAGLVLLALALVVGLTRFLRLSDWSLWIDEALTLADYHHGLDDGQIGNPLGYVAIGRVVELLSSWRGVPPDELSLRLLPALCGYLALPATFWALRRPAGALTAGAAALLLAASPWHLFWSQTARFYTMAQLVAILGAGLCLRGYLTPGSLPRRAAACGAGLLAVALGALFHPSCALLLPALVAAPWAPLLLTRERQPELRRLALWILAVAAVGALLASPWAWKVWTRYQLNKPDASPAHFVLTTGFYVTPLWGAAAAIGAALGLLRREAWVGVLLAASGGALFLALAVALQATISAQYVFVVLPFIAALAASPAAVLLRSGDTHAARLLGWAWIALLVLPPLSESALYFHVRNGERSKWREAYEFVWRNKGPDDLVLGMAAPVGEFYAAPGKTQLRNPTEIAWIERWRAHAGVHSQWALHPRRTWFVLREEWIKGFFPQDVEPFRRMLREECRLVQGYPLWVESRDLSVNVYVRD